MTKKLKITIGDKELLSVNTGEGVAITNKDSEKFGSTVTGYLGTVYSVTHLVEKSTIVFDGGFELEVQPRQMWITPGTRVKVDYIDMSITYIES